MPVASKSKHQLPQLLLQRLQNYARLTPQQLACALLDDAGNISEQLTYQQLNQQAHTVAAYLHSKKLVGKRVLLLYPAGLEFISAFLGCLYAGVVAVPVACPAVAEFIKTADTINAIGNDADIAGILTQSDYAALLQSHCKSLLAKKRRWVATAESFAMQNSRAHEVLPPVKPTSLAYLQYTSGSTSAAKGVMITQNNLTHSLFHTGKVWNYTSTSVSLTWAPHSHIYGLICGLLLPLYQGARALIMSPAQFIKQPLSWLRAIEQHQVSHSGCPNFGYDLCVQHITPVECSTLNLSNWKVAINGGEPIRQETLEQFAALCAPGGFNHKHLYLAYGMSEATGLISGQFYMPPALLTESSETSESIRHIFSLGKPLPGMIAIVVDPEQCVALAEGETGEIWLQGTAIAAGYWRHNEEMEQAFTATVAGQTSHYFRTGDLGYLQAGEVFLTGRLKELLIVFGKKYHALDLEFTCSAANADKVTSNSCVAFSIEQNGREAIILLQEIPAPLVTVAFDAMIKNIRSAVSQQHQIDVYGVLLVAEQSLPRTASGKLQRRLARQYYLDQKLSIVFAHYKPLSGDISIAHKTAVQTVSVSIKAIQTEVKEQVARLLRVPIDSIDLQDHVSEYGFDSITTTQLVAQLNNTYQLALSPAVLFEFRTLAELCERLAQTQLTLPVKQPIVAAEVTPALPTTNPVLTDIAIIGMSGRFPGADTLEEFWQLLVQAQDQITEIPAERWHWQDCTGDDTQVNNKNRAKWGGFMKNVRQFDAAFFNISRHEAELMDPQQRLFLQTVWHTFEDAGYAPGTFSGSKTGVFVGVSASDYTELLQQQKMTAAHSVTGSVYCMIANRISYLLDLTGPSEAIDTACSSSLVAIHRAIQSLQNGDCDTAIAGGVNLLLTPRLFLAFSQAQMLSEDGRCKTFDATANGYVRGEGVGAVLLKPLAKAIADNDHIYGVIKGSAINHGGHVRSLTVPNPNAQAAVIASAVTRANIDIDTVQYIEAHGTGTSLGDPIEINGLKKAFVAVAAEQQRTFPTHPFCGIGSVKTNIGHLEAAAGIAGVIKVLLAMQHKMLPSSLHFHSLNPYIELADSPFYLVQQSQTWKRPEGSLIPYRAGVSSFGFGGVNAHLVLEQAPLQQPPLNMVVKPYYLITISAKTEAAVQQKLSQLQQWLTHQHDRGHTLGQIAYTLNLGRDHFAERRAMVVQSLPQLRETIAAILQGQMPVNDLPAAAESSSGVIAQTELTACYRLLQVYIEHSAEAAYAEQLKLIAKAYVKGATIDWFLVHAGETYLKMALPGYPFAEENYWLTSLGTDHQHSKEHVPMQDSTYYTDMTFTNVSTADYTLFKTVISGKHFFIKDHVFCKKAVLPGVAYIEIARWAASLAYPERPLHKLKKITWLRPLILAETEQVEVYVYIDAQYPVMRFEIYTEQANQEKQVHTVGQLDYAESNLITPDKLSLSAIRQRVKNSYSKDSLYTYFFPKISFEYGVSFRLIEELYSNQEESLVKIALPATLKRLNYVLHPSLLDASIQALMGIIFENEGASIFEKLVMPFSIEEIMIYKPLTTPYYLYIQKTKKVQTSAVVKLFDLYLVDEQEHPLVKITGLNVRQANNSLKLFQSDPTEKPSLQPIYFYEFPWQSQPIMLSPAEIKQQSITLSAIVFFADKPANYANVYQQFTAVNLIAVQVAFGSHYQVDKSGLHYTINPARPADYQQLLQALKIAGITVTHIVYLPAVEFLNPAHNPSLQRLQDQGIISVFLLTQALLVAKLAKEIQLLYCYQKDHVVPWNTMINGFAKTLIQENPNYHYQTLELPISICSNDLPEIIQAELVHLSFAKTYSAVRYERQQRWVKTAKPLDIAMNSKPLLKQNSVCLITGGLGGVGLIIAKFLVMNYQAKLVLVGRSMLTEQGQQQLQQLTALSNQVEYLKGDVTDKADMQRIIETIHQKFGQLNGVFHCAGLTQDSFILKKDLANFSEVLAPKVTGTYYVDQFTQQEPLDYFVLFSSVASVLGNIGQSDYASANAFLDAFTEWRNEQVVQGQRQGHTVAINWPVWEEGGMQMDDKTKARMEKSKGMTVITTNAALDAMTKVLNQPLTQVAVATGDPVKIEQMMVGQKPTAVEKTSVQLDGQRSLVSNVDKIIAELTTLSATLLKADVSAIDINIDLSTYGLDSMIMLDMLGRLDKRYNISLLPTAFSEYPTITLFAQHIAEEIEQASGAIAKTTEVHTTAFASQAKPIHSLSALAAMALPSQSGNNGRQRKIAVISVACRFPKSPDVETYWQNLVNERRLIQTGVPSERWDHSLYYHSDKTIPMKTYANWGGFVDHIDLFDPQYFGISEASAYGMDPQHRIMLELTQELFDRAGYKREEVSGKAVSVVIGGGESDYVRKFLKELPAKAEAHQVVNRISNMMASRISDFYNLTSFSHTLDAACSSALLAIHQACNSILTGDADMAIAGGAELLLDPISFVGFSKAGTLSDDGFCYVFDERAKGFVMSEGFGLILLKDYEAAVRDGDRIMATILATSTNNDGRTVGLTTPNGKAQKQAMQTALTRSGIAPETITYLEAHGTGTLLGDPIEIKAASELYGSYTSEKNYCAVASVKSNMGHSLRAAGVASVIKVVLALQNQFIPATLHCEKPHPRFQFDKTPFYPNIKGTPWSASLHHPRRAAVSAFAFGGTNVHAILEEYAHPPQANIRASLPITSFNRRSYWLGNIKNDYKEIIRHLAAGNMDSQLAVRMLQQRMTNIHQADS